MNNNNIIVILLILNIVIVIGINYNKIISPFVSNPLSHSNHSNSNSNPCTDLLTDIEYLEHMIPHHQVALDMSNLLIPNTQNPDMLNLCRNIIRKQSYEIWEMTMMKKQLPNTMFSKDKWNVDRVSTMLDLYYPKLSKSNDGVCNPLFFKPNDHSTMMHNMKINDRSYLEHMIPHHQVAIDMSERLLLHTNHSYLLVFCRKLIIDQQYEIFYMNNLLKTNYKVNSNLI